MVELQKDLLVQEKQRLLKIWPKLYLDIVWFTIVQMVLILKPWVNSSKDWLRAEPGAASMSLTESIWKCFQSSLNKFSVFKTREREVRSSVVTAAAKGWVDALSRVLLKRK